MAAALLLRKRKYTDMKTILSCLIIAALFFTQCTQKPNVEANLIEDEKVDLVSVEHGEYMVKMIGCDHCHTPKKMTEQGPIPDMERWLMGYPANEAVPEIPKDVVDPTGWLLMHNQLTATVGPWGVSYAANLTPHETGIGNWTYENFKTSMREGRHKGLENGRPVMPPMPWQSYAELKESDLQSIFEYLKSIKPIENVVPTYTPPNMM